MSVHISREENPEATEYVTNKLRDFNDAGGPLIALRRQTPNDPRDISFFARNAQGEVIAGLIAKLWITWKWLEIDILWVDDAARGLGIGTQLLLAAEAAGIEAGCTRSRLSTWDFQAPEFYAKHGYKVYGKLENFPEGFTDYRMWKPL